MEAARAMICLRTGISWLYVASNSTSWCSPEGHGQSVKGGFFKIHTSGD
jgi:hypothetical protein